MSQIFISYRRADSQANTDRIYERLVLAFGRKAVFKDVDDIPPGVDFPHHLQTILQSTKVVLVIIGNQWVTVTDEQGKWRLDNPHDFVRTEVEFGLVSRQIQVIPVLVNDAKTPSPRQLPHSLQSLSRINSLPVRNDPDFNTDMERLVRLLQRQGIRKKIRIQSIIITLILLLFICIGTIFGSLRLFDMTGVLQTPEPTAIGGGSGELLFYRFVDGQSNSVLFNITTHAESQLTIDPGNDFQLDWSSDGERIAFHSDRNGNMEIYTMNADGNQRTNISNNTAVDETPSWSLDASQIAFHSDRSGSFEIYVMDADGGNPRVLTNSPDFDNLVPAWSPDGHQIAFETNRDGNFEIYVMNSDGSNPRRLTNNPGHDFSPSWSPDSGQITFESYRNGVQNIYIMDVDGRNQVNITGAIVTLNEISTTRLDRFPAWSPDSNFIAFQSSINGQFDIFIVDTDGDNLQRITDTSLEDEWTPRWQPATR